MIMLKSLMIMLVLTEFASYAKELVNYAHGVTDFGSVEQEGYFLWWLWSADGFVRMCA